MLNPFPAPGPVRQADPSGGPVLARSTTILQCPAILSGSLSGLQLPSFSTNLVSTAAVQDAMVTTTTTGGQRVAICTCIRTGRHLATFTRRPGSSLYSLTTEPAQVASSGQVSASGQVAAPCSCRLLSHQNLLWHHRLGHPSQPRLCGMHSRLLVSGLPRSLPPLPPYLPCVKGRQRAAPHSSFPTTTAPLQNLHMDVKREVSDVLTPWIRVVRLQLRERFREDLPVMRLHSDRGVRCASAQPLAPYLLDGDLDYTALDGEGWRCVPVPVLPPHLAPCPALSGRHVPAPSGVLQVDPLPLAERVEVTVESGPAGGGAARGTASGGFKLAGAEPGGGEPECAEPESAEPGGSESEGAEPGGAEPESAEPGGAESEGAESGGAEPRGPADGGTGAGGAGATSHGVAGGTRGAGGAGPGGARTRGTGAAGAGGVGGTGARDPGAGDPSAGGAGGGGTSAGGTSAGGAGAGGTGAGDRGAGDAGAGGARAGDPGAGGTGARDPGAGGAGARGAGAGGAGAGGTGAGGVGAGGAGAGGAGAGGAGAGSIGAGGTGAGDFGAGGAGARGAGASGTGAGGFVQQQPYFIPRLPSSLLPPSSVLRQVLNSPLSSPSPYADQTDSLTERREPDSHPALPVRAICTGRHVPHPRPPPVPGTHIMTLRPSSFPLRVPLPSLLASSLAYSPDPESDLVRAASPSVTRLLATVVTDHSFESAAAYALVAEVVDIAAACRLDYATSLVAESESDCPPFVRGECALGTDVLEDRWEEFECLAAAVPHLVAMLLAPEGDPNAPDIPTPRSYVEAITGPYSSQWQTAMDVEMASWKSTGTYTFSPTPKMTTLRVLLHVAAQHDYELHSLDFSTAFLQGSLHEEIWLRCPPGFIGSFPSGTQWSLQRPVYGLCQAPREWHDTLRSTLVALGFAPSTADPSLFKRTDTSLPPFYIIVYVDDSVTHGAAGPSALRLPVLLATVHSSAYLSLALSFTFRRVLHRACGSCFEDGVQLSSLDTQTCLGSSREAEIYAGAMAAQELRWPTYLLTDLGERPRSPLETQRGQLRLVYVATRANTAVIFTKALKLGDHQRFCTV
ncbi:unnamed protein product [Closterium sp. NIES-53]